MYAAILCALDQVPFCTPSQHLWEGWAKWPPVGRASGQRTPLLSPHWGPGLLPHRMRLLAALRASISSSGHENTHSGAQTHEGHLEAGGQNGGCLSPAIFLDVSLPQAFSRLCLGTTTALGPWLHKANVKHEQKGRVVHTLRYRKKPAALPISVGSVNQHQRVNGWKAHAGFIFCGSGDPQLLFTWSIWVWPLRKGIPLAWAGFHQPLIKLQPCFFHLETDILQNLGRFQRNAGVLFACKEEADPKCSLLLYNLNSITLINNHVAALLLVTKSVRLLVLPNPGVKNHKHCRRNHGIFIKNTRWH